MENFKDWFRYPFQDTIHTSEAHSQKYLQIIDRQSEEIEHLKEQIHKLSDHITELKRRIDALEKEKVQRSQLSLDPIRISASSPKRFASQQNMKRRGGSFYEPKITNDRS